MTQKHLETMLHGLFKQVVSEMAEEPPKKLRGEGARIYKFAFNSYQAGFLHGMTAGLAINRDGGEAA